MKETTYKSGRKTLIIAVIFLTAGLNAFAAGGLSIKLVKATDGKNGQIDKELRNVAPALERNLAFTGYTVIAESSISLPADGKPAILGPYIVRCKGDTKQLSIAVEHKSRQVLKTIASIAKGKPLILGGLPSDFGVLMLLFDFQE